VRHGERATTVVLWKSTERVIEATEREDDEPHWRRGLLAKGFSVFNAAQVDGFEPEKSARLSEGARIHGAEQVLFGVGADIQHGGGGAYYNVTTDTIHLPRFDSFRNVVGYYATLAHELTHWTGAKPRLDRDLLSRFGSGSYAVEELIAEFGAAFLCARFGLSVEPRPDHADYIGHWLAVLKSDKKALFTAASRAQQAVDWLLQRCEAGAGESTLTAQDVTR
jgi:antirestriction protein ArdC